MSEIRILVIDQDSSTTGYLKLEFKKLGIDIFTANSFKEGLILAYQHRPQVIILDPILDNTNLKEVIHKLHTDLRLSRCKLIAFSSLQSPEEVQSALNLGFDTFMKKESGAVPALIRKTLESVELAAGTTDTLNIPGSSKSIEMGETGIKGKLGKTIVFISAKGGIGTSSLCANIAHLSNIKLDNRTTLVDLVLPIGSISTIVGLEDTVDIIQASKLNSSEDLVPYLSKNMQKPSNWNFSFMAGSNSPSRSEDLNISQIFIIIDALKKISDYLFIDIGKTLSRISLPIITSADQIVLTLSLDQTTVQHTKEVWNFLKQKGVQKNQIYFLINRAVGLEGLAKSEVEEILDSVIQLAIPYMGSNFTLANNLHQPVADKFPQDAVSISLRQASDEIFRRIERRDSKLEFF